MQPKNGGKVNKRLSINLALMAPDEFPPLKAAIIPNVESARNMVWSQIMAILSKPSPYKALINGKPIKEVLLYPLANSSVLLDLAE